MQAIRWEIYFMIKTKLMSKALQEYQEMSKKWGEPKTVKDTIAQVLRAEGYDFLTAYEIATKYMKEFLDSGKKQETYGTKNLQFTLKRKERGES